MVKKKAGKAKPKTALWQIGRWATIWWLITWVYILGLVAHSLSYYADIPAGGGDFFSNWSSAISSSYHSSSLFSVILIVIVLGWLIGGIIWIRELKKQNVSYKSAFKDLFLTVRK